MKIVFVVDNISNLNQKINLMKNHFGDNIFYIVRADLLELFKTYGFNVNATYYKNLAKVMHVLLASGEIDNLIIYHSSLPITENLITKFRNAIGLKNKIVGILPKYSNFEKVCNSAYNFYVKSLFNAKDSLVSNKLQFIPESLLPELLTSHISNRLFQANDELCKNIEIQDSEINKAMKHEPFKLKYILFSVITALLTTVFLLMSIAYFKVKFIAIAFSIVLYLTNIFLTIIFSFKSRFDQRFLK